MSLIKEKYVIEFQELYLKKFNIKLSYDEALKECIDMVELGKAVYGRDESDKCEE